MDLILDDDEVKEITFDDFINGTDQGKVIIKGEFQGKRNEGKDEITKEIIAYDSIELGPSKAAEIHGVPKSSASKYSDGLDIKDEDAKSRILAKKHDIADTATAKLMETLGLFDPSGIEKQTDIIRSAAMLASIVEKVSGNNKGGNNIELHLYAPKQNSIEKYPIIDVG